MSQEQELETKINKIYKLYQSLNKGIFSIAVLLWGGAYGVGEDFRVMAMALIFLGGFFFNIVCVITVFVVVYLGYIFRKDFKQLKAYFWKIVFISFPFIAFGLGGGKYCCLEEKEVFLVFSFLCQLHTDIHAFICHI